MSRKKDFSHKTVRAAKDAGDCCWACGVPGWFGIEADHAIPRNNIACTNGPENINLLCAKCNNIKGDISVKLSPRASVWASDQFKMAQIVGLNRRRFRAQIAKIRKGKGV